MAVQLLENWLLKEQEKIQTKYRELNQISVIEPDIIFIGDSIIEYYPLQELLGTSKTIVNRGIRGYQTGLLRENLDAHLYGDAVDQIVLLIGTNDMGKEVPMNETLNNLESVIQTIRTNEKIKAWNQAYQDLASAYMQVDFVPVFENLLDQEGQLKEEFTTDGLHLSVSGYQALSSTLKKYIF